MKEEKLYFEERQQFTQPFLWMVLYASFATILYLDFRYWIMGDPVREDLFSSSLLLAISLLMFAVLLTFWMFALETKVGKNGLHYRFYPIHGSFRNISWNEIRSLEVRTYSAMKEYQGWGLRYSMTGKGWAYNVKGNKGLQIVKKDGTRILLGTQRPKELEQVLRRVQGRLVQ